MDEPEDKDTEWDAEMKRDFSSGGAGDALLTKERGEFKPFMPSSESAVLLPDYRKRPPEAWLSYRHVASDHFWERHSQLPDAVQRLAKSQYEMFKKNPSDPSLNVKNYYAGRMGRHWWVLPIGQSHRAIGEMQFISTITPEIYRWIWIGSHNGFAAHLLGSRREKGKILGQRFIRGDDRRICPLRCKSQSAGVRCH